jgi:hypothetical protein
VAAQEQRGGRGAFKHTYPLADVQGVCCRLRLCVGRHKDTGTAGGGQAEAVVNREAVGAVELSGAQRACVPDYALVSS